MLTPANVGPSTFGLLKVIPLDDQVDGHPLFVPGVTITAGSHQGLHDVVYVATEGNTIYAIDAEAGTVLLKPNFGKPVGFPIGCTNNGPNVGINSTPVIDLTSNTLYVLIYTQDSTGPAYRVHAPDLGSLADKTALQLVVASHNLTDGTTFNFNATYQRQRPGLPSPTATSTPGLAASATLPPIFPADGCSAGPPVHSPSARKSDLQHPGNFARQLLPLRYGCPATDSPRMIPATFCSSPETRLLRHNLRRSQQHSGERS